MPLYEYRCLGCHRCSTVLVLSLTNHAPPTCSHCLSPRMERMLSRFASPKSEAARLEALTEPDNLAGLDENDPQSMARFMKKMGDEIGEDLGSDLSESIEPEEVNPPELEGTDSL